MFVVSAEDKQDEFTIERVYSHGTGVQKSTFIDYVSYVSVYCVKYLARSHTGHFGCWRHQVIV